MTIDEVMKLEGRELDAAVAGRLNGCSHVPVASRIIDDGHIREHVLFCPRCGKGNITADDFPHFSTDWNAAMQVREWVKSSEPSRARMWVEAVSQCETARNRPTSYISFGSDVLLHAEPVDYARAALVVSP